MGALLLTAALLSGCSGGPAPLGASAYRRDCFGIDAPPGKAYAFGQYPLQNKSRSTVTIQSVTLDSAHFLKMTEGAWILPAPNGRLEILAAPWPPPDPRHKFWFQRKRAEGAQIKPGETVELVVTAARTTTTRNGRSIGPLIVYTTGGDTFRLQRGPAKDIGHRACGVD